MRMAPFKGKWGVKVNIVAKPTVVGRAQHSQHRGKGSWRRYPPVLDCQLRWVMDDLSNLRCQRFGLLCRMNVFTARILAGLGSKLSPRANLLAVDWYRMFSICQYISCIWATHNNKRGFSSSACRNTTSLDCVRAQAPFVLDIQRVWLGAIATGITRAIGRWM